MRRRCKKRAALAGCVEVKHLWSGTVEMWVCEELLVSVVAKLEEMRYHRRHRCRTAHCSVMWQGR